MKSIIELARAAGFNEAETEILKQEISSFANLVRSEALAEQSAVQEPCGWQFFQDGKWHNGSDRHDHRKHTEDAGIPVRDVYPAPQPAIPPGYKLVPVEPTQVMLDAAWRAMQGNISAGVTWDAMLNAAPEAPQPAKREPLTDEEIDALWLFSELTIPQLVQRRMIARIVERAHGIGGEV